MTRELDARTSPCDDDVGEDPMLRGRKLGEGKSGTFNKEPRGGEK